MVGIAQRGHACGVYIDRQEGSKSRGQRLESTHHRGIDSRGLNCPLQQSAGNKEDVIRWGGETHKGEEETRDRGKTATLAGVSVTDFEGLIKTLRIPKGKPRKKKGGGAEAHCKQTSLVWQDSGP